MTAESAAARTTPHERDEADFYVEPIWSVVALLTEERFCGKVYDPACGTGTIVKVCTAAGIDAYGTDLVDRGGCRLSGGDRYPAGIDFTRHLPGLVGSVDNIICNPPFKHAERFIEIALIRARYKVAMLVRLAFLEGQKRRVMFESTPLARVLVFSRRVSMPPGGRAIEAKGGAVAFCWLVFDHDHRGPATLGWLA